MNASRQRILVSLYTLYVAIIFILLTYVLLFDASIIVAIFFLLLTTCISILIQRRIKSANIVLSNRYIHPTTTNKKTYYVWWGLYGVFFIIISTILYQSWLNGDDFGWLLIGTLPFWETLRTVVGGHLHWVARHGDSVATLIGVSLNHWQVWILNAAVIAFAPFAFLRLLRKSNTNIVSFSHLTLVIFLFSIFLSSNGKGWWIDYTCFVAGTTYIWTSVITVLFLSYFNKNNWNEESESKYSHCLWVFALGLYSGWGTECLTVILLPILLCFCLYKKDIPISCLIGLLGFSVGATLLFVSPAHMFRAEVAASFRGIIPENMTYPEILNFVQNLTMEKLYLLGAPNVTLQGIPYHLHTYFFPYMANLFWGESKEATIVLLILLVISLFGRKRKTAVYVSAICIITAWTCASSYLAKCIPSNSAFVPPVFFLIGACGYIFFELSEKQKITICALSLCYMLWNIVPAGIEAHKYKKYELSWYAEIQKQKDNGAQDIILSPIPEKPINRLYIIKRSHLTTNPQDGANKCLAQHFGVNSIRIQSTHKAQKQD